MFAEQSNEEGIPTTLKADLLFMTAELTALFRAKNQFREFERCSFIERA
jgi:hypothetical protein